MGAWMKDPKFLNDHWKREYRMTYSQCSKLINTLTPYLKKQRTQMKEAAFVDKKLVLILHRLGFRNHVSNSRNYFGLSLASTSKFTYEFCKVLMNHFYKKNI